MIKRWKRLSNLECVKEFGFRHKISNFLGIHMLSKCAMVLFKIKSPIDLGKEVQEGYKEGLERK